MQKIFIQNGPLETKCPKLLLSYSPGYEVACEEGPGLFAHVLTFFSLVLILVTLPLSLLWVVKVVQEYERAVIFRLGRLIKGGARGPGVFFIIPCLDVYQKIDMRTATYDVPPQEVRQQHRINIKLSLLLQILTKDSVTVFVNAIMYYKVKVTCRVLHVSTAQHWT